MSYTRISIHVVAASHFFRFSSSFILKKKRTLTETRLSFLSSSFYSSFFVWPLCLALESWTNQSNELLLFSLVTFGNAAERIMRYELKKEKWVKKKDKVTQSLSQPSTITLCSGMCITTHQPRGRLGWHWMGLISVHESIASSFWLPPAAVIALLVSYTNVGQCLDYALNFWIRPLETTQFRRAVPPHPTTLVWSF
jgi:hypothetical protein